MNELLLTSPIISISLLAVISLIFDAMNEQNMKFGYLFVQGALIIGLLLSLAGLFNYYELVDYVNWNESYTKHSLNFTQVSYFFDAIFCIAGILTLLASRPYLIRENVEETEYYNLILYAIAGMMIIVHSNHMLTAFIGIETMSLTFYVLAGYFRFNKKSVESAMKYFLLGAFATGFLVYGMAMIYGATGSMQFDIISSQIASGELNSILYLNLGFGMLVVGLAFKMAIFPFHQWAPDVYTGAPTVVTAFMSTAGKAAAVIIFILIAKALLPLSEVAEVINNTENAKTVLAILSAVTMLVGNITAVVQKNVKRMLAFSSVAHAGYLMMGLVANTAEGWKAAIFYITAYVFMQIGAFILVSIFERDKKKNLEFSDYSGLYKSNPMMAVMMAIFMLSLAGIPPLAGFFGKYLLFIAAIKAGFTWLTLVAVVSSVISMYFYIGLIKSMWFDEAEEGVTMENTSLSASIPVYLSTIFVVVFGILPFLLDDFIAKIM
jgi:NADH-quinone oxidoreductase subunit N